MSGSQPATQYPTQMGQGTLPAPTIILLTADFRKIDLAAALKALGVTVPGS